MKTYAATELLLALQEYGYLETVPEADGRLLAQALELTEVRGGDWLFKQGANGDSMYVLFKGVMRIVMTTEDGEQVVLDVIDPGTAVGELALLTGQARSAGVQAISDSALIRIPRQQLLEQIEKTPSLQQHMLDLAVPRLQNTQMGGVLGRYFGDLDAETLRDIKTFMTWQRLRSGEVLFAEGDPADAMAILVNGRLQIVQESSDGRARVLGEVSRGENVGEYGLLTGQPRSATVRALRDSDILLLDRDDFNRLGERYPHLVINVARDIAMRARADDRQRIQRDGALTFAVLALSAAVPLRRFARQLEATLSDYGHTLWLCGDEFDQRFGRPGAAQLAAEHPLSIAMTGWLNQQEAGHRYVVYEADHYDSAWTRRCLRNADRVVLVADATAAPDVTTLEDLVHGIDPRPDMDLVLLHPSETERPTGTAAWLDARPPVQHHHLRHDSVTDYGRLARRLIGQPLALILGGGAARGYAHIGVFGALRDAGYEVDIFGGTSMGALVAAGLATHYDAGKVKELAGRYGSKKKLLDLTFPTTAVYKSEKVTAMLQEVAGDVLIEDLWHPFFCVSSNLSKSEPMIHTRGPLWQAVRASLAIPGVFSPANIDGDVIVDGGVMNNLPVDIMRALAPQGYIIAVNANPRREKAREWTFGPAVSGWEVLRNRYLPGGNGPRVPSLVGTVLRALAVNSAYQLAQMETLSDLFIQLDTSEFGIMDWESFSDLIDLGYEEATAALAVWEGAPLVLVS